MSYTLGEPTTQQYFDENGDPLENGSVEFFLWNTSTETPIYSDESGTSAGTSVTLDEKGRPSNSGTPIQLFFDSAIIYKMVLKNSSGDTEGPTMGPYYGSGAGAGTSINVGVVDSNASDSIYDLIPTVDGQLATCSGYYTAGDGGGGQFVWKASNTDADDGIFTVLPTGHVGAGRWKRNGTGDGTLCNSAMAGILPSRSAAQNQTAIENLLNTSVVKVAWFPGLHEVTGGLATNLPSMQWIGSGSVGQGNVAGSTSGTVMRFTGPGWGLTWGDGTTQRYNAPHFENMHFEDAGGYADELNASVTAGGLKLWSASHGKLINCSFAGFPIGVQFLGLDENETGQRECQYWNIIGFTGYLNKVAAIDLVHPFSMKFKFVQIQGALAGHRDYLPGSHGIRVTAPFAGGADSNKFIDVHSQFVEKCFLLDGSGVGTLQRNYLERPRCEAFGVGVELRSTNRTEIVGIGMGNHILNGGPKSLPHGTGVYIDSDTDFTEVTFTQVNSVETTIKNNNPRFNPKVTANHAHYHTAPEHLYRHRVTSATYEVKDYDCFIQYDGSHSPTVVEISLPEIVAGSDTWQASTAYSVDDEVVNGSLVYICTSAGTSAGSGGPSGTGTGITDGGVTWDYQRQEEALADFDGSRILIQSSSDDDVRVHPQGGNAIRVGNNKSYTSSFPIVKSCVYSFRAGTRNQSGEWILEGHTIAGNVAALTQSISNPPTTGQVSMIQGAVNQIRAALINSGQMVDDAKEAWQATVSYTIGDIVENDSGKLYYCVSGGTSAGSGGPTGTGSGIVDGTVTWDYIGVVPG